MKVAGLRNDTGIARVAARMPARVLVLAFAAWVAGLWAFDVIGGGERRHEAGLGLR